MASANPFVQRTRNERFSTMFVAYLLGSLLGGAATGGAVALLGSVVFGNVDARVRLGLLAVLALVGVLIDRTGSARHIRGWARQVPERWRYRYRAPVWGFGYGLQLGAAFATIVASSATWVAFVAAALSADAWNGVLIGAAFGLARAAMLLPARAATSASSLREVMGVHARVGARAVTGSAWATAVAAIGAMTWAVVG